MTYEVMSINYGEVVIRQVSTAQISQIHALEELCFKDPYSRSFLSYLAQTNPTTFIVATIREHVIGYAVAAEEANYSHLISIAVHPGKQRNRIGGRLLKQLETSLDRAMPLRLEVRQSNLSAIMFYRKNGFQEDGLDQGYYSDGENAVLMSKNIYNES